MIIKIKSGFRPATNIVFRLLAKLSGIRPGKLPDCYRTPVIINNFNRFNYLKQLIEYLQSVNLNNIHIIDNASTYPPLLAYYKTLKYPIYLLNSNVGHDALWKTHIYLNFRNKPYIYTDPDILPAGTCPPNFIEHLFNLLNLHQEIDKVGLGLMIDDLPDHFAQKDKVLNWEARFWDNEIDTDLYEASVDTTFALYRAHSKGDPALMQAYRTGGKFVARHLPWYEDSKNLSREEKYYREHCSGIASWVHESTGQTNRY